MLPDGSYTIWPPSPFWPLDFPLSLHPTPATMLASSLEVIRDWLWNEAVSHCHMYPHRVNTVWPMWLNKLSTQAWASKDRFILADEKREAGGPSRWDWAKAKGCTTLGVSPYGNHTCLQTSIRHLEQYRHHSRWWRHLFSEREIFGWYLVGNGTEGLDGARWRNTCPYRIWETVWWTHFGREVEFLEGVDRNKAQR